MWCQCQRLAPHARALRIHFGSSHFGSSQCTDFPHPAPPLFCCTSSISPPWRHHGTCGIFLVPSFLGWRLTSGVHESASSARSPTGRATRSAGHAESRSPTPQQWRQVAATPMAPLHRRTPTRSDGRYRTSCPMRRTMPRPRRPRRSQWPWLPRLRPTLTPASRRWWTILARGVAWTACRSRTAFGRCRLPSLSSPPQRSTTRRATSSMFASPSTRGPLLP